jgi:hypothetical protein
MGVKARAARKNGRVPMNILLDPDVRTALRMKKTVDEVTISNVVNDAVRKALRLPAQAATESVR